MSDTEKIIYDEWKKTMEAELAQGENQNNLLKAVIEGPEDYLKKVMEQEENPEIAQKRMLTESPMLNEHKLRFNGEKLVPDWDAHENANRRKKVW